MQMMPSLHCLSHHARQRLDKIAVEFLQAEYFLLPTRQCLCTECLSVRTDVDFALVIGCLISIIEWSSAFVALDEGDIALLKSYVSLILYYLCTVLSQCSVVAYIK